MSTNRNLVFILLFASAPVFASNATGYVRSQCPLNGDSHLYLTHVDGRKLNRELNLRIPPQMFWDELAAEGFREQYEVPGEMCASGECEPAVRSKVQILQISRNPFPFFHHHWIRAISGNFEVELRDGRKLAGSFKAKFLDMPKPALCE